MQAGIEVVVAHDDGSVVESVATALEAASDVFVVGTTLDAARSGRVLVAGGSMIAAAGASGSIAPRRLIALAGEDALSAARAALAAGASEIVHWPGEAARLPEAIRTAARMGAERSRRKGRILAVAGARGGVGVSTTVALIARHRSALVVDLDGGQRAFTEEQPDRAADHDLGALGDAASLESAAVPHAGGARVILTRTPFRIPATAVATIASAVREAEDVIVVDCGRARSPAAAAMFAAADARLIVLANDATSVQAALDLRDGVEGACTVAVRRDRRVGVAVRDIAAALGGPPAGVIPRDAALARAVDLGMLPARASRAVRAVHAIADAVLPSPSIAGTGWSS